MSSEVWLPITTLVLGILLGYVADWLREERSSKREREERWKTFQRETILETQNSLAALSFTQVGLVTTKAQSDEGEISSSDGNHEFAGLLGEFVHTLHMLTTYNWRLQDKELRAALGEIIELTKLFLEGVGTGSCTESHFDLVGEALVRFNRRANEILPDLY